MAETNIVAGLFGMNPQMYERQQYQQDLQQGYDLARLDPGAAARAQLPAGIGQLGRGFAGAMGIEDPQLKLISARNSIFQQIDQSNPESMLQGIKMLGQMGDQQGAMALAEYYRKAQSETALAQQRIAAAGRERQQALPPAIQIAQAIANAKIGISRLEALPESPERDETLNRLRFNLEELQRQGGVKPPDFLAKAAELQNLKANLRVLKSQPEPNKEAILRLEDSIQAIEGVEKVPRSGEKREAVSNEMFDNRSFQDLTPKEKAIVNKRLEDEEGTRAEKGAAKLTNVMPGQKDLVDIPEFRAKVQKTIAPQIESVNAADQALQAINDSITSNNFVSFNAARVQLAKALGDSQLSRRDVEQAGGDPSLFGKLLDSTSTLFTGTPTLETQNLIKNTLQAVKRVSTNKANREINIQKDIAYSTPGYDKARVDLALRFPEFEATKEGQISGDYAAQARELLKQRQQSKEGKK